jgi:hypothetical protein
VANEDDELEEFLGIPRKHPKVGGRQHGARHCCVKLLLHIWALSVRQAVDV